jgi:transposase
MLTLCSCILLQKQERAMAKKYIVNLADDERAQLLALTKRGKVSARRLSRAHILLQADTGLSDDAIAQALHIGPATVERIRKRFVEDGLEAALSERPRPGGQRKLDGKQEAFLIALACSTPPEGRACWTMQLLADRLVELQVVEAISDETVRRTLKKTRSSRGRKRPGVFRA